MVSIIIPFYNEKWKVVSGCVSSLLKQNFTDFEIILVDDGSTINKIHDYKKLEKITQKGKIKVLSQKHSGPAEARNLGVRESEGDILVFVDADMEFENDFLKDLTFPIINGKTSGTFSREEFLLNKKKIWAVMWNMNRYIQNCWKLDEQIKERILPSYYPLRQKVFRAIRKDIFLKAGGFDSIGYTDDWTLSRKTGLEAEAVKGAKFYHNNPETLKEVFLQARWFGKNEFIVKNLSRKLMNLVKYSFPFSVVFGIYYSIKTGRWEYPVFRTVYDFAVFVSIIESFYSRELYK